MYKRQVYGGAAVNGVKNADCTLFHKAWDEAAPVSYTHLDVYKRQGEMFNAVNQMNYDAIGADGWEISEIGRAHV